jgi:ferredoxin
MWTNAGRLLHSCQGKRIGMPGPYLARLGPPSAIRHEHAWEKDIARPVQTAILRALSHLQIIMAEVANKYPENVTGKYYVDDQCIDCDLCRETAPANFTRNDDGGHSYVHKQPTTPEEETLCKEAMEGCPVEAIGSDGE